MTAFHRPGPAALAAPVEVSVADLIAAVVLACPLVAGLHGGRFGGAATYLPGRRVTGIRITPAEVFVHLVARYPATVTEIDAAVRAAVRPYLAGLPLTIIIEDYVPAAVTAPAPPSGRPGRVSNAHATKEIL